MTVKNYIASGATDPANPKQAALPAEEVQGHVKSLVSTKEILNTDSIASTVKFGSIPSNARILRNSALDHDAITGLTDFDLGIGQTVAGVLIVKSADCLINGATLASAGSKALTAIDLAALPYPAWKLAGYAADPGGFLDIVGTLNAAAGADGTVTLTLLSAVP